MAIVGIDEVGRGAWAGPLVVGAVLLGGATIEGLTDSKKLTKAERERLDKDIRQKALAIGLGWVSAKDIDTIGLSQSLKLASRRALRHIKRDYHEIIIDGTVRFIEDSRVTTLKKADLLVPSVSAASIVAKVARDNYMKHVDAIFPGYTFKRHVGYGTAGHRSAIKALGITPLHRLSYVPLMGYQPKVVTKLKSDYFSLTTKRIGDAAEEIAATYLIRQGHKIVERNWKTKYCEIDIVSRKGDRLFFTEVKYRRQAGQGGGIAAITPKKKRQMTFAAELYAANSRYGGDQALAVITLGGAPPKVELYLEIE